MSEISEYIEIPNHIKLIYVDDVDIDSPEFEELVKKECKAIRNCFTQEQIDKLSLYSIDGDSVSRCVYGTMLGSCNSPEVADFIINNLDTLIYDLKLDIKEFDIFNRSFESILTPMETYIKPFEWEYQENEVNHGFAESYYKRIANVLNWIKE